MHIDNRKDILLLLLYSPGLTDCVNEPIAGRTRLVKMLFLFKKEILADFKNGTDINEDMFYAFFPWDYGPFSRDAYNDITFFVLRGFIHAAASEEETLPEEAEEWEKWQSSTSSSSSEDDVSEFEEERFTLTKRGREFVELNLYSGISDQQKKILCEFKKKALSASLRVLLKYVYKNYPEFTKASVIKEAVLGS